MSIVVTCRECEASYKLPDRYAGKRCRCKACKAKIQVPAEEAATEPRRKKKRKRKPETVPAGVVEAKPERKKKRKPSDDAHEAVVEKKKTKKRPKAERAEKAEKAAEKAGKLEKKPKKKLKKPRATARLGSQEGQIRQEGRDLRRKLGGTRRRASNPTPVSESIHQLAPLNSGDRIDPIGLSSGRKRKKAAKAATAKLGTAKLRGEPKTTKGRTADLRRRGARKIETRPGKAKGLRGTRTYGRRGLLDEDAEEAVPTQGNQTRYALFAILALIGLLCMGVGLAVGGAFGDGPAAAASESGKKLDFIEKLTWNRQWESAQKEATELRATLEKEGDTETIRELDRLKVSIDNMVVIRSIEDDESKLNQLLRFVNDGNGAVRLGVAMELRPLAFLEDGQRALVTLAKDSEPRVAAAAKQGMVHVGGPKSIPFLLEAIEDTAKTGGKLGDVAIERALEIQEPEIVPVLVKILETRQKADASILRRALSTLTDLAQGDEAKNAAKPYLEHEDEGVKKAAEAASR